MVNLSYKKAEGGFARWNAISPITLLETNSFLEENKRFVDPFFPDLLASLQLLLFHIECFGRSQKYGSGIDILAANEQTSN